MPPTWCSHPEIKVVIGGYCDERGSNEYNLALGQNRAEAAKNALVSGRRCGQPHPRDQLRQGKAVLPESTEECWQLNRRDGFIDGQVVRRQ